MRCVGSNINSWKYRFTPSGCKNIMIRKSEFVFKAQFLLNVTYFHVKKKLHILDVKPVLGFVSYADTNPGCVLNKNSYRLKIISVLYKKKLEVSTFGFDLYCTETLFQ